MNSPLSSLLREIHACRACADRLPLEPKPILQAARSARLLVIGQAPGIKAHDSGIPWNDASGRRLREWLGLSDDVFYDAKRVAIVPMGFCYPGKAKSGDLPPRKECFPLWHGKLLARLPEVRLTVLVGGYAQSAYLGTRELTGTVRAWREHLPKYLPLPHPSPRNNIWLRKNPWFEAEVLPELRRIMGSMFS